MAPSRVSADTTVVFITGASSGIGYEVARNLSTPSFYGNHHVIIGSLDIGAGEAAVSGLVAEDPSRSGYISAVQIDVTSDGSIAAAVVHIMENFGHLDVLINNAGVLLDGWGDLHITRPLMDRTFQVNVFGAAAVTEACIPLLEQAAPSGAAPPRIVFMSSRLGSLTVRTDREDKSGARPFPAYRSSKAALNMVMLHYAGLFRERGWKVNACDPGLTRTALAGEGWEAMGTVEEGARNCVRLATLGADGETGTYSNTNGLVPW
ncbi:hypothetical protein NKR23_g12159 [Pleurostoma richardsiae]|uniref:Uncharacterized protein n=1 Tax=Pleurostoma richardsiae TaxID=41990 RepID=A0AA38R2B6_9PEZI|nr:hypothetical protein NKR23_g12159 [Pleurostoma richardsiae]